MFKIIGSGMYLPEKKITNQYFIDKFGPDPLTLVFERIGHGARYYSAPDQSSADLAVEAGKQAILKAGISPSELDLLIVATDTPSQLSPATSAEVQYRLEATNAGTFDLNCACAGFVTSLDVAARYMMTSDKVRKVIIIGTYGMSKFLDPNDPVATPLFGDGAGAIILSKENKPMQYGSRLKASGQYWDYMGIYAGGTKIPITKEVLESPSHLNTVKIPKRYPATLNQDEWPPLVEEVLSSIQLVPKDVDMFIFTQIRKVTIEEVMAKWSLPMSRTHTIMEKWGYTGSACVPMAFHDAIEQKKVKRGDRVVFCASGGGYAMACATFVY